MPIITKINTSQLPFVYKLKAAALKREKERHFGILFVSVVSIAPLHSIGQQGFSINEEQIINGPCIGSILRYGHTEPSSQVELPFGLNDPPGSFQQAINMITGDLFRVLVYGQVSK